MQPDVAALPFPEGYRLALVEHPAPSFYLDLYRRVGAAHCWWMRYEMPTAELTALLHHPAVSLYVLYTPDDNVAGFFEIDRRQGRQPYLSHLGLLPDAIGHGLGRALLYAAIRLAWSEPCQVFRVNTCTADHPRALPTYLNAGFRKTHVLREIWDIPDDLGLPIPETLRLDTTL